MEMVPAAPIAASNAASEPTTPPIGEAVAPVPKRTLEDALYEAFYRWLHGLPSMTKRLTTSPVFLDNAAVWWHSQVVRQEPAKLPYLSSTLSATFLSVQIPLLRRRHLKDQRAFPMPSTKERGSEPSLTMLYVVATPIGHLGDITLSSGRSAALCRLYPLRRHPPQPAPARPLRDPKTPQKLP